MSDRAQALAERFEKANQDLIATVEGCSDEQWRRSCVEETWSVGVTAHHVASGQAAIADFVEKIAKGEPLPNLTMDMIHEGNARHAEQFANCTREETAELLRTSGASAASTVRGLSDEELDRSAPVLGGDPMSAQHFIENVLVGHIQIHLKSIRAAAG